MLESAGAILYRLTEQGVAVLLVHPSGNYNRRAPWSIPKGLVEAGESPELAARRETEEETGVAPGTLTPIGSIDYRKSRKRVYGFAGESPQGAEPRCASWEIDRAEFLPIAEASSLIHPDQLPLLERVEELLKRSE
jgi:predicted NUDIX family NTP pyrophosphohydrolase